MLPDITLYNSLTKKVELFQPLTPGKVGMYHCGPTVYDDVHIGNLRAFLLADITRRVFSYHGYQVTQVMNITDVGHLSGDGDHGDDKMTRALAREKKEITVENMLELAKRYEARFVSDLAKMNIQKPHHMPRASDHIQEDINIISTLKKRGFTYESEDSVYFSTETYPEYGALGLAPIDDSESRTGVATGKKHPRDFALWKKDSNMGWPSPWGQGFPGWHIECSGMSMKYLGEHFDIHTGGIDLLSTHHNNEIAQSTCATEKPLADFWLHNEHVNLSSEKMSKSLGNIQTLQTLSEAGFSALDYRYWLLQSAYRTKINFSLESLQAAKTARLRLNEKALGTETQPDQESLERFSEAVRSDFNTAEGLSIAWEVAKSNLPEGVRIATLKTMDQILGLSLGQAVKEAATIPKDIQLLAAKRDEARASKDWVRSDEIRDIITAAGYEVRDTDSGTVVTKR